MKLRAEGGALDESFNQLKLWLEVRRRMKFQQDETLAEGAVLAESFNQLKLWLKVWRRMKFQPDETLVYGGLWSQDQRRTCLSSTRFSLLICASANALKSHFCLQACQASL